MFATIYSESSLLESELTFKHVSPSPPLPGAHLCVTQWQALVSSLLAREVRFAHTEQSAVHGFTEVDLLKHRCVQTTHPTAPLRGVSPWATDAQGGLLGARGTKGGSRVRREEAGPGARKGMSPSTAWGSHIRSLAPSVSCLLIHSPKNDFTEPCSVPGTVPALGSRAGNKSGSRSCAVARE